MDLLEIVASVNGNWDELPEKVMAHGESYDLEHCHYCALQGNAVEVVDEINAVVTGYHLNNHRFAMDWDEIKERATQTITGESSNSPTYFLYSKATDHVLRGVCGEHLYACEFCGDNYSRMTDADNIWDGTIRVRWDGAPWVFNASGSYSAGWLWDDTLCLSCAQDAATCDRCETLINRNYDNYGEVDGDTWCSSCVDDYATFCDSCDQYHTEPCEDDDGGWSSGSSNSRIHDYSFKPDAKFGFTEGDLSEYSIKDSITGRSRVPFMGFELEVEAGNASLGDGIDVIQEHLGSEENYVYLKGDGSLDCGFEIVSHPATLASHKSRHLGEALKGLSDLGFRSWRTNTCGIHVHVSRAGFSNPSHVWKFTHFIVDNKQAMVKLAGRDSERWANFNLDGYTSGGVKSRAKGANFYNRYEAINFGNARTLELRFFKGSLRVERLLSALELTEGAVEYTRNLTTKDVMGGGLDFRSFVTWLRERADKYPNLLSYVDTLYLSEYERVQQSVPAQSVSDYF
jgi:hypothetical protein